MQIIISLKFYKTDKIWGEMGMSTIRVEILSYLETGTCKKRQRLT